VCRSKKYWQARHTGVRITQQIAITMGCAVLPRLRNPVDCVAHSLSDEQQKVETMTTIAIAALAEAAAPYGIESSDSVLKPFRRVSAFSEESPSRHSWRPSVSPPPPMDSECAPCHTKEATIILIWEF